MASWTSPIRMRSASFDVLPPWQIREESSNHSWFENNVIGRELRKESAVRQQVLQRLCFIHTIALREMKLPPPREPKSEPPPSPCREPLPPS